MRPAVGGRRTSWFAVVLVYGYFYVIERRAGH
jgi:hypothetical protein